MRFFLSTFNHCLQGRRALFDVASIMGHQLIALGHAPLLGETADFIHDGFNVVFESFADPRHPALPAIAEAHARGARFIYVATEKPGVDGFNDAPDQGMRDRQAAFADACQFASGVLHLVPGENVTAWYACHAPSAYAELGYSPNAMRDQQIAPDHDFGFFGKLTPRRSAILDNLAQRGSVITLHDFPPAETRDAVMSQAKVIVQLREWDFSDVISSSRICTALSLGRPIVAEPHANSGPWSKIVHLSRSIGEFYGDAVNAARTWKSLYQEQCAAFVDLMTPERCIGEPLRKLGIL